jgi:pyrimidine operon attenuation protein / uracil phosphoribosyltransferase
MSKICILGPEAIQTRLRRMAYEIFERNYLETQLTVIGIDERGGYLAHRVVELLREISDLDIRLVEAHLDRQPDGLGIDLDLDDLAELKDQAILVVDDVLYTGSTMLNVVAILLQAGPKSIQTAVLIDRGHRQLPIAADMTGLLLATTIHQHVSVEIDPESDHVEAFLL